MIVPVYDRGDLIERAVDSLNTSLMQELIIVSFVVIIFLLHARSGILALIPTLLFTSIIVFASIRLIPGDIIDLMLAQNDISTGQDRAVIEAARPDPLAVEWLYEG